MEEGVHLLEWTATADTTQSILIPPFESFIFCIPTLGHRLPPAPVVSNSAQLSTAQHPILSHFRAFVTPDIPFALSHFPTFLISTSKGTSSLLHSPLACNKATASDRAPSTSRKLQAEYPISPTTVILKPSNTRRACPGATYLCSAASPVDI